MLFTFSSKLGLKLLIFFVFLVWRISNYLNITQNSTHFFLVIKLLFVIIFVVVVVIFVFRKTLKMFCFKTKYQSTTVFFKAICCSCLLLCLSCLPCLPFAFTPTFNTTQDNTSIKSESKHLIYSVWLFGRLVTLLRVSMKFVFVSVSVSVSSIIDFKKS